MALSTIANLRNQLGVGARPNLFQVNFTWPNDLSGSAGSSGNRTQATLLCKALSIPAFTVGVIEVPYRGGRRIKVPGDRSFGDWTATFISDDAQNLRNAFKTWIDYIENNNFNSSTLRPAGGYGFDYISDLTITHFKNGPDSNVKTTRSYILFDCFPTDVSAIDLAFDSTDTISEFTVTFQYHTMTAATNSTPISSTEVDSASAVSLAT